MCRCQPTVATYLVKTAHKTSTNAYLQPATLRVARLAGPTLHDLRLRPVYEAAMRLHSQGFPSSYVSTYITLANFLLTYRCPNIVASSAACNSDVASILMTYPSAPAANRKGTPSLLGSNGHSVHWQST
jgi:hypothetical protein